MHFAAVAELDGKAIVRGEGIDHHADLDGFGQELQRAMHFFVAWASRPSFFLKCSGKMPKPRKCTLGDVRLDELRLDHGRFTELGA